MRRGKPLRRKTALKRGPLDKRALMVNNPPYRREDKTLPGATGWTQRVFALYGSLCVVCSTRGRPVRAVHAHHVVPRRTILARGEREIAYDQRNGLPICKRCHELHEDPPATGGRIPRSKLLPGNVEWAEANDFGWYIDKKDIYPDD